MVDAGGPVGEPEPLPGTGAVDGADAVARGAAERLIFFSDAVVAIAITLLAIDLPVPAGDDAAGLLASLRDNAFAYLTFVISFVVIAAHWRAHHAVFRYLHRVDRLFVWLNLGWLLVIVTTPFLTEIIREGELNVLRFGLYASAQSLLLFVFGAMKWVAWRRGLYVPDSPVRVVRPNWRDDLVDPSGFLVSIPLYPLLGAWAFALWWAVPNVSALVARTTSRRSPSAGR